jgi:uncharacterized protein
MMNGQASRDFRVAVITALVGRSKRGLGRTGLMKLSYFLQALKNVPLGYSFRLYTYGPYEAQVLEDLKVAEVKGAVKSTVKGYPTGYGYEITPGENAEVIIDAARDELAANAAALDWVLEEFSDRTAIDLEMVGTIIYVDRASHASGETLIISDMATRVHAIKPRLALSRIETEARSLLAKGLLTVVH